MLLTDFNLIYAKWDISEWSADASSDEQTIIKDLYGIDLENFLTQKAICPNHNDGNTSDLVFTSNSNSVLDTCALPT